MKLSFALVVLTVSLTSSLAYGDYDQRISLGVGIAQLRDSSQTDLEVGLEYEYRFQPLLGVGFLGNYIFSDPGITFLGAPEVFFHPLATDWLISASPIIEFGSWVGTHLGVRIGTRVPIDLGALTLVPTVAVDMISGGPDYIFGIGIQI